MKVKKVWIGFIAAVSLIASGCGLFSLHRVDQQQGNIVTQNMVNKLKPGMTREQVIYVMGVPIVRNSFDNDRWDYVYTYSREGGPIERKLMTLHFEGELLVRFEGYLKHESAVQSAGNEAESFVANVSSETT